MTNSAASRIDTGCAIVGAGPAGLMLGLLLARAGVDVTVIEKHADFLRDFRGDTIHPSTLEVMHELGLLDGLLALPHTEATRLHAEIGGKDTTIADFSRLPTKCRFIAFMPQWDFLDYVAGAAWNTGAGLGDSVPWSGTAADLFMQLQFPLHSGRIAGLPGRILLSVMGIVVAALSLTGIVIWFKKRLARAKVPKRNETELRWPVLTAASAIANSAFGTAQRFIYRLTDEDRLRSRVEQISRSAPHVSASANASLWTLAVFSARGGALIFFVALVAIRRLVNNTRLAIVAVWRSLRSFVELALHPGFWTAGKADAKIYGRRLMLLWHRLSEFAASTARRAFGPFAVDAAERRAVQRISGHPRDKVE